MIDQIPTGVEPEGMAVSPDGKTIVNTSETTNMAHFFDFTTRKMVASVLVGARPRIAQFKHDGSEVWVSSELGGTVSVIDPEKHVVTHKIEFAVQGLRAEGIQPVGIRFTEDGATAFVALGPANRVAVIDTKTYTVKKYLLVGQRVWQMAFTPDGKYLLTTNGLSNDVSVIDVASLRCGEVDPGGTAALGCRRGAAMNQGRARRWRSTDVSHAYGTRKALDDVSLIVPQSRFHRVAGSERRRQDNPVFLDHSALRHAGTDRSTFLAIAFRPRPGRGAAPARRGVSRPAPSILIFRSWTTCSTTPRCTASAAATRTAELKSHCRISSCPTGHGIRHANCPADRCAVWRSPARCCMNRACWCWMSPRLGWMSAPSR